MSEHTIITTETANLVSLGSVEPAAAGDIAGIEEELAERRSEAEAAETEIASLTRSYDDEVADHLETAKRAFEADKHLVNLWELLHTELGFDKDPTTFFSDQKPGEPELMAAIIAAQARVKAAADRAATASQAQPVLTNA